jgi:hypothetical protein
VQEFGDEGEGPWVFVGGGHCGKPHLPVEPEVIGGDLGGGLIGACWEAFVGIFFPLGGISGDFVICSFEHNVVTFFADRTKSAVGIDEVERVEGGVHDLVGGQHIDDRLDAEKTDEHGWL